MDFDFNFFFFPFRQQVSVDDGKKVEGTYKGLGRGRGRSRVAQMQSTGIKKTLSSHELDFSGGNSVGLDDYGVGPLGRGVNNFLYFCLLINIFNIFGGDI